jgi:hypothetical protein
MRRTFRYSTLGVAFAALIVLATPVAAANPWTVFKQSGVHAIAHSFACVEDAEVVTCAGEGVDVFEGATIAPGEPKRKGEQACYSAVSETYDAGSGEPIESEWLFGCTLDAGTVSIDRLNSVSLTPTTIHLTAVMCDASGCTESQAGTITVDGTWTGVGPTESQKSRSVYDDGGCLQVNADRGRSRQASFVGSIDAADARIGEGGFTFRTTCDF